MLYRFMHAHGEGFRPEIDGVNLQGRDELSLPYPKYLSQKDDGTQL